MAPRRCWHLSGYVIGRSALHSHRALPSLCTACKRGAMLGFLLAVSAVRCGGFWSQSRIFSHRPVLLGLRGGGGWHARPVGSGMQGAGNATTPSPPDGDAGASALLQDGRFRAMAERADRLTRGAKILDDALLSRKQKGSLLQGDSDDYTWTCDEEADYER